jgi:hypothetical protein
MAYQFDFDGANRILRCRWDGPVTDESLRECYSTIRKYVALTHPRAGILDFSGVTSFEVASKTVQELARFAPPMSDPLVPRYIVAPSAHMYGLARMFQLIGEPTRPRLEVLRTSEEAYTLLGVEAPHFKPLQPVDPS